MNPDSDLASQNPDGVQPDGVMGPESAREHQTLQPVCPVLNNENSHNHCIISSLVRY